nr:substance-K receptor-like isoform X2 [Penaeus vannamei]XP_027234974.1 substance-K receptor-like isoform X2 [Penaeus vannamei]
MVMMVSVLSLATISCDRMVGVVYPFHRHLRAWQSFIVIGLIWVVSAGIAVPFGLYREYAVHKWRDVTERTCEEANEMRVWWLVSIVALTWVPLGVMLACYALIFINFNKYKNKVRGRDVRHPHVRVPVHDVHQPSVNPIVYALMHHNFRRAFRVTFACAFKGKPPFVLTPGHGTQKYVWSARSGISRNRNPGRSPPFHRLRRQGFRKPGEAESRAPPPSGHLALERRVPEGIASSRSGELREVEEERREDLLRATAAGT